MHSRNTAVLIQELVRAIYGAKPGLREQHIFSHALHGLVRLAKVEQTSQIKMDVKRAIGSIGSSHRHQAGDQGHSPKNRDASAD